MRPIKTHRAADPQGSLLKIGDDLKPEVFKHIPIEERADLRLVASSWRDIFDKDSSIKCVTLLHTQLHGLKKELSRELTEDQEYQIGIIKGLKRCGTLKTGLRIRAISEKFFPLAQSPADTQSFEDFQWETKYQVYKALGKCLRGYQEEEAFQTLIDPNKSPWNRISAAYNLNKKLNPSEVDSLINVLNSSTEDYDLVQRAILESLKKNCIVVDDRDSMKKIIECLENYAVQWIEDDLIQDVGAFHLAVEAIGYFSSKKAINEAAITCLNRFYYSGTKSLKMESAKILARFASATERNHLEEILKDTDQDCNLRIKVALGLAARKDLTHTEIEILRNIFRTYKQEEGDDEEVLYSVAYALGRQGMLDDLRPVLDSKGHPPQGSFWQTFEQGPSSYYLFYKDAIRGLCKSDSAEVAFYLNELMKNSAEDIQVEIFARKKNRDISEKDYLIPILEDSNKPLKLRLAAAQGLGACAYATWEQS